jgi:cytochrome c oxidase subunit 1
MGMPRRVYTYPAEMGWQPLNIVATAGSAIATLGALLFVANAILSLKRGAPAGPDPWGGATLEWSVASPTPAYNFEYIPTVDSLTPLWNGPRPMPVFDGPSLTERQVLVTSAVEAVPQYRQESAKPSIWPLVSAIAVGVMFVGSIFTPWAVVWGSIPIGAALTGWFWPHRPRRLGHRKPT